MRVFAIPTVATLLLAAPAGAKNELTDQQITDAVEHEILLDRAVDLNSIDIATNQGVVTFAGEVDNIMAKERAERLAEVTKGVSAVVNRLRVVPPLARMDWQIRRDVKDALLYDPATESYEVAVKVKEGQVTLSGAVESWAEKDLAGKVAKAVRGVTQLENDIDVRYSANRTDSDIRNDIMQRLKWNALVDHGLVRVNVSDGAVKLSGTVGSSAEIRQARQDAWVIGTMSVDASGLKVKPWAKDDKRRKNDFVIKSDAEIEKAVSRALFYDTRVLSTNVTPDVFAGKVTLRGIVATARAAQAAAQDARNTVGVLTVDNRLRIMTADLSAETIEKGVEKALRRDPYVERYEVDVDVEGHTVTLSGVVDTYFDKYQAFEVAQKAKGVDRVRNNLVVSYQHYPLAYDPYLYDTYPYDLDWYDYEPYMTFESDWRIEHEIRDELWWSPFVDSDQVKIEVDKGVATLTGTVDTPNEMHAAIANAYDGGATWVDNELRID